MISLASLKWLPIRMLLPFALLLVSGAIIGGFWWFEVKREMAAIEREVVSLQLQDMHRLVGHLQSLLLNGELKNIASELSDFGSEPNMQYILLTRPDGHILAASRLGWVGQKTDALEEPVLPVLLQHRKQGKQNHVYVSEDGMTVWAHYLITYPPENDSLRSRDFGELIGKFDLALTKQAARHRIEQWVSLFATLVLGSAFLLWLAMRYAITRRMNQLIAAANQASKGNFSARAGLEGSDELAQIGKAFDSMIERLGRETMRQRQLSHAVENMAESVLITNAKGVIEYVNSSFTRISGYSAEEAIGQNPSILKSGKHPTEFYKALWRHLSQGKVWTGRMTDRKKDGSLYLATVSIAPLLGADGRITHYVGVHEDISEQQKMEMQLMQAQKMESLGILVGGIAHDFNNMLAGMVGNLYMARKAAKDLPEITQKLARVEKLSFRAADMIKQLLAFARKDTVQLKTLDLTSFIKEAYKLARVAVPEDITCLSYVSNDPLCIECDATQVQQMLMNLLGNARDALRNVSEPKIILDLQPYEPDATFISQHPEATSVSYAMLSIKDNGCGIPDDVIERIFEPFFTTKGVGHGSGLGLSMVFGTMQSHQGIIEVESKPGLGSSFRLFFPISDKSAIHDMPDKSKVWRGNGERLLLADDEPLVRDTISEMLCIDGFTVDVVDDGLDAVEQFCKRPDAYDAVILDVVMPGMGGVDAAQKMREVRPDIPIIFATGYDREHVLRGVEGLPGIVSLSKPLHSETLHQTLTKLLHKNFGRSDT